MDLSNDSSVRGIISSENLERSTEFIGGSTRAPRAGTGFAELGAAVLGVGGGDAAGGYTAWDLHHDGAVGGRGEEIIFLGVSIAAGKFGASDGIGVALRSGG